MKRVSRSTACCAVIVFALAHTAAAQGKGGSKVKTVARPTTTTRGAAASHSKSGTVRPASSPKPTGKTTRVASGGNDHRHTKTTTVNADAGGTTTAPTSTVSSSTRLTRVQQKLQRNTQLASRLESRLPAGTNLNTAASGFKNLGQFVAAVNVSNNLGLDFTSLKTSLVTDGKSLGQAIQAQKGGTTAAARQQAQTAQRDADTLIRSTERQNRTAQDRKTKTARS